MVVRAVEDGWEIIYHRAHALLAAKIALQWGNKDRVERVAETIAAIAQHDDLEREFEGYHLTTAGAPMDFTQRPQDIDSELPRWKEMLTHALYRSRWVALLSARHICFLNGDKRRSEPGLDRFLTELEKQCATWRDELGIAEKDVETSYAFMQWCDRLSLILAQDEVPARERWLEISIGPDDVEYALRRCDADGSIEIKPWPFQEAEATFDIEVRRLTQLHFRSNNALMKALADAPVSTRSWTFRENPPFSNASLA